MPGCDVWDLVKVPFPYTRRPVQQRRPALVIAAPDIPGGAAAALGGDGDQRRQSPLAGDVAVSDLPAAGLAAASVVRPAKIATMEAGEAERIGQLSPADRSLVQAGLRGTLAAALAG